MTLLRDSDAGQRDEIDMKFSIIEMATGRQGGQVCRVVICVALSSARIHSARHVQR